MKSEVEINNTEHKNNSKLIKQKAGSLWNELINRYWDWWRKREIWRTQIANAITHNNGILSTSLCL